MLRPLPLIALAAATLTGCGVLKIDVDVYKGPLANHEDVQIQQFTAMAVGARPLLDQLKKNLDAVGRIDDGKRVEDVISLYEDLELPDELAAYLRKSRRTIEKYSAAMNILVPNDNIAAARWERIRQGFVTPAGFVARHGQPFPGAQTAKWPQALENMQQEFREIIDPANASGKLRRTRGLPARLIALKGNYPALRNFPVIPSDQGSNAQWESLTKRALVKNLADLLFDNSKSAEIELFKETVLDTANAFIESRTQIRNLWSLSLRTLSDVETMDFRAPSHSRTTSVDERHENKQEEKLRSRLIQSLAHLVSELSQPQYIAVAISRKDNVNARDLRRELSRYLPSNDYLEKGFNDLDSDKYAVFTRALRKTLVASPRENSERLLNVDAILREAPENIFQNNFSHPDQNYVGKEKRRQFGVARGPTFSGPLAEFATRLLADAADPALARISGLFSRGRLQKGILTLIENYLQVIAETEPSDRQQLDVHLKKRRAALDRLLEALVRFSEKILVIANNDILLAEKDELELNINRYVVVLQAIGNSILIQADELRSRARHKEKMADATGRETFAVASAYSTAPRNAIKDIVLAISGEANVATTTDPAFKKSVADLETEIANLNRNLKPEAAKRESLRNRKTQVTKSLKTMVERLDKRKVALQLISLPTPDICTQPEQNCKFSQNLKLRFRTAIEALIDTPDAGTDLYDAINQTLIEHMAELVDSDLPDDIEALLLAKEALEEIGPIQTKIQKTDDAFNKIRDSIEMLRKVAAADVAEKTIEDGKLAKKIKTLDASILLLETNVRSKSTEKNTKIMEKQNAVDNTLRFIDRHQNDVIIAINSRNMPSAAGDVKAQLLKQIERVEIGPAPEDPPNIEAVKKLLTSYSIPFMIPPYPPAGPDTKANSAKDVLDDIIAILRQEHIRAIASESGGGRAKLIEDALAAAYDHRSGMVYIRPSASYLRSSYPSTSLQNDPGLLWENMLQRHAYRSVPFFGELVANAGEREKARITAEIDKQFWQTINSVRVSGAGDTNYVVAKDDIGNWYVKNYSSDPKDIIKSAKNLALFGIGSQMGTNLLKDGEGGAGTTSMERLFTKYRTNYATRTKADLGRVKAALGANGIRQDIAAAWAANNDINPFKEELENQLNSTVSTLDNALAKMDDSELSEGLRIVGGLHGMRLFRKALVGEIARKAPPPAADPANDPVKAEREAFQRASRDVTRIVRASLLGIAGRRQDAVNDYETSIMFIGDATKQEEASNDNGDVDVAAAAAQQGRGGI